MIFGIFGFIILAIGGKITTIKETNVKRQAEARGFEYGIYYELKNGEDLFCFIHKDLYKAEKCLRQLRKEENFTQTEDWSGDTYEFRIESFEQAIGEKMNRQKFKILKRSLIYNDNKNFPRLHLKRGYSPRLVKE